MKTTSPCLLLRLCGAAFRPCFWFREILICRRYFQGVDRALYSFIIRAIYAFGNPSRPTFFSLSACDFSSSGPLVVGSNATSVCARDSSVLLLVYSVDSVFILSLSWLSFLGHKERCDCDRWHRKSLGIRGRLASGLPVSRIY